MNFKEAFRNRHAVLPVVHVENQRQAIANSELAFDQGSDGVFLISMKGMHHRDLLNIAYLVKEELPDFWLGVNFLDLEAEKAFRHLNSRFSGLWSDDARIDEDSERQMEAASVYNAKVRSYWDGLYFGGVAFKYKKEVKDPARAARLAAGFVDVITTSGSATGVPPDAEKIQTMKEAIGNRPLAVASGITPENVHTYTPYADAFLVSSSLLVKGTENFDRFRVRDLVAAVR